MMCRMVGVALLCGVGVARAQDSIIHAGVLLEDGVARKHVSILVHDDKIVRVADGFVDAPDAGTRVIDLSRDTVMPGFIDCHVHISMKLPSRTNATEDWLTHTEINRAFDGAVFARALLQQGFASARDVGGSDDTTALRDAIDSGQLSGPRLWVSLEPLGPTAGHDDPRNGLDPALEHPGWERGIVDSA